MSDAADLISNHLDIWTSAIEHKSSAGRGRGKGSKISLYGIEKLRALILDLAVRGKLVPQDSNDEPASELLKCIKAEKQKLIAEKKIKKGKVLPPITDDEKPFDLPKGWEWCRISELGHDLGQKKPDQNFTYIDVGAINKELGIVEKPTELPVNQAPSRARKLVKKGTVIYSTVRPYLLNIAVIDCDFDPAPIASTAFAVIHPFEVIDASYVYRYLRSPTFVSYVESCQSGIAYPAINDKRFFAGVFPLPPLAEQKRIVGRVDELMGLCDALQAGSEDAIAAHQLLVKTLLATLTDCSNATEITAKWSRIAPHFDLLFTTLDAIDQLKQTVLQLAVMGKLVPQNPNDEPASELLKRIKAEKQKLIAEGKIKKSKPLPPITENEKPFDLPEGWELVRLQEAIDVRDGTHDSPKDATGSDTFPLVTSKDFKGGKIDFEAARRISASDHFEIAKRSCVEKGDILFSMIGGNIGNQVMVETDRPFSIKNVALFKYYDPSLTNRRFVKKYFELLAVSLQSQAKGGAQPFISLGALRKLLFCLPPLAEQKRIVARVDELMALCEQLKTNITAATQTQKHLADTIVKQATA